MGVSKTICIDFTQCFAAVVFYKWIVPRNTILTISTVITAGIYTKNTTPNFVFGMCKKLETLFNTPSVSRANVQQAIVFIARFGKRVESNFLNTMNTGYKVCPEKLPALS